jgi:predicted RecB family nuclease
MTITPSLFEAFLKCPTKCWLRATSETPSGNTYAEWVQSQNASFRATETERLFAETPFGESVCSPASENLKASKWRLAVDVAVRTPELPSSSRRKEAPSSNAESGTRNAESDQSLVTSAATEQAGASPATFTAETRLHAVERVPSEGQGKAAQFIPIRFFFTNKLGKDDRLLLALDAFVLSVALGREIATGKIIHGDDHATLKVKTSALVGEVRKRLEETAALLSNPTPPDLVLNRHCAECEFQARCRKIAIEKDDLSLLAGMSGKDRKKLRSKGIFTVTQLSYTFRPRRRPKRLRDKREKYHHSLKALAIREKKIHIVGSPELKIDGTPVYLDVEGLPDRDFYYLIGVRIGNGESAVQHSLWADTIEDEGKIWREFLAILKIVEKPVLIHYGSYETTFLKRMGERFGKPLEGSVEARVINSPVNLVSFLFARIYFPTHSNGLKNIGGWLGCEWLSTPSCGTDSIVWRSNWERSRDKSLLHQLITYNLEDCAALQRLTEASVLICSPDHPVNLDAAAPEVVLTENNASTNTLLRRFSSPISDFEFINKAARWDFQRDRIYIRTDKALRRIALAEKTQVEEDKTRVRKPLPINKTVNCQTIPACPFCGGEPDRQFRPRSLVLHDLRFGRFGIRRWVVRYRFHYCRCGSCLKRFGKPEEFWPHSEFGRNLVVFVLYEMIELCVPQMTTTKTLSRFLGLRIGNSTVNSFKASAAAYYSETRQSILAHLTAGKLIHADETPIALTDRRGYVWVFTSMDAVVYYYSDTREGDVLRAKLKDFVGVLVSDFYAAYDSLSCPQQKCLLHLMRDLNAAVLDLPFDEELRHVVLGFGTLLKGMVDTIDRWGLKRHFLRKHIADVERFYRQMAKCGYQSEAAVKCRERFEKNRQQLFTFLEHDGIPWNNNNAEHAIKAFARLRRIVTGWSSPKGIEDYLILLSICQTCKYMGVDFLDFLRSGEKDIHAFVESQRGRKHRSVTSESKALLANESAEN